MNFWLASANPRDVARHMELGVWRGVITNPAVVAAERRAPRSLFTELVGLADRAWYQLRDASKDAMLAEADAMLSIDADRIGIKVPATRAGLGVLRVLADQGAHPMATVVPTATWLAYVAAAGATMVAPYGGMLQRAAIASKYDEVLRMQQIVDAQGYDLDLCVGLYDPTDVPMYARAGVCAGFVWARDVDRFFAQPLVDEACAGFADDWATIDAAHTE
jgi:transaldolase